MSTVINRCFHSNIDGYEAEKLLLVKRVGTFLIRRSNNIPDLFVLSIKCRNNENEDLIAHIRISEQNENDNRVYSLGGEMFETIKKLIDYYYLNEENIFHDCMGNEISLKYPLDNGTIEPIDDWFHGTMSTGDAYDLINENLVGSYLVYHSGDGIGYYVLCVGVQTKEKKKIRRIKINIKSNKYQIANMREFDTLTDLIESIKQNPLIESNGNHIELLHPIMTSRIILKKLIQQLFPSKIERIDKAELISDHSQFYKWLSKIDENWKENDELDELDRINNWLNNGDEIRRRLSSTYYCNDRIDEFGYLADDRYKMDDMMKCRLSTEYETILRNNYSNKRVRNDGFLSINVKKNRYRTIIPFDANRIRLKIFNDSDYINANYLQPSFNTRLERKSFITTQGCLPHTALDFWQMVWQESIRVIVMLAKEEEYDQNHFLRSKCFPYYPTEKNRSMKYGQYTIEHVKNIYLGQMNCSYSKKNHSNNYQATYVSSSSSSKTLASGYIEYNVNDFSQLTIDDDSENGQNDNQMDDNDDDLIFIISKLIITNQIGERRIVFHCKFVKWNDHIAPTNLISILIFRNIIHHLSAVTRNFQETQSNTKLKSEIYMNMNENSSFNTSDKNEPDDIVNFYPPILLHCSAGIGRTGTFLAIDTLSRELEYFGVTHQSLDILRTVKHLRYERDGMIQTEVQYQFIYIMIALYYRLLYFHELRKDENIQ
ncbi:hypothetical protein SNEBB_010042 [Seison nebaliae]|nr:hypothetical protein SNEBB_010042 [Seison nebaliae]